MRCYHDEWIGKWMGFCLFTTIILLLLLLLLLLLSLFRYLIGTGVTSCLVGVFATLCTGVN